MLQVEKVKKCILLAVNKLEYNDEYAIIGFCSAKSLLIDRRALTVLFQSDQSKWSLPMYGPVVNMASISKVR